MRYHNLIKRSFLVAMVAVAATACKDEVNIGNAQAPETGTAGESLLYVTDAKGNAQNPEVEFRGTTGLNLFVNTTSASDKAQNVTFAYDATALEQFNKTTNNSFEAIPQSWVTFSNGGVATLEAGAVQSAPVEVNIASDGSLDHETTYVIPVRITTDGSAKLAAASQTRMIFVKDLSALPDCFKTWTDDNGEVHEGVKIFSCMEVNDTNPLNNLRYTLKNSGKYMVDALIMFAGNINYDPVKARVYFNANPNVQHLLDNRMKYLKPLKDRGMKVIMGVMCNHDRACISNLNDESARLFAQELKAVCDAYDLDGIFWDDEYCSPIYPAPPGFVNRSNAAFSRLAYEVWKAQPDRWNVAYGYSMTSRAGTVDGVPGGTYITYVLPDYGYSTRDWSSNFSGMPRNHMGACSMEFAQGRYSSASSLKSMRDQGYGACMVFAMDPFRSTASGQDNAMGNCARSFYDDEVVIDPVKYKKDW